MPITTTVTDRIAEIVFDVPPVNAFDSAGWNSLPAMISEAGRNPEVNVVLIRAAETARGFCGGVDIKEMQAHPERITLLNRGNYLTFKAIRDCEVPVVVAVHKFVIGGGIGICGASDTIIAADDAYFSLPEVDRGAMGGASHLSRMLPLHKVRAAFFTGGTIPAEEAYRLGGVEKVVPREKLVEEARAFCAIIAAKSRKALVIAKEALNGLEPRDVDRGYRWEQGFTLEMYMHEDSQKARDAFVEDQGRGHVLTMDLRYTPEQDAFRAEVRAWMRDHVPARSLTTLEGREGFAQHVLWERELAAGNWGMVTWPEAYGGRALDLIRWLIFEEEYWGAGAPLRANQNGIFLLGPTIMEYGTDEQKARFLTPMAKGEVIWAQAWSEPNAGSDMAAIRSRAVRDGDHYVISGQKTWSSRASFADWGFGLFRTDPESKRHKGLSFILFDLNASGVTRRPIRQLHGEPGFAELFFDDVRVPIENRIAGEGEGWNVAMATAGFERGLMLRSPARFQAMTLRLIEHYRAHAAAASPAVHEAVLQAWMDAEAYALNTYAVASTVIAGGHIGAEASLNKIFWSELDRAAHRAAMSLLGASAELRTLGDGKDNSWLEGYIFSLSGPIYAGSNEIQRNIVAERLLGLPR